MNWNERYEDRIKQMIIRDFKGIVHSIEIAASPLNITVRSLQRKLKEENTSYRNIITSLKKELDLFLADQNFEIAKVADILGYSDSGKLQKLRRAIGL